MAGMTAITEAGRSMTTVLFATEYSPQCNQQTEAVKPADRLRTAM
jgi:hypothetical protein